jgi:hypothetical protein
MAMGMGGMGVTGGIMVGMMEEGIIITVGTITMPPWAFITV